ncbi:MAG: hypothetical protein HY287_08885 [Planctomycetes bacterium]|nr:hypothetical protein [Planctomycetota bacterium]
MIHRILLLASVCVPCSAFAQSDLRIYPGRLNEAGAIAKDSPTNTAAAGGLTIEVSKTASVDGQNVSGVIRIKNTGAQSVTVSAIADSLEVHFPRDGVSSLPAGSTRGWFSVADVPIPLPGPIVPGKTTTINYCFSLCLAADSPGANSMRNVVAVSVTNQSGGVKTVTTRSISFTPPILDCQACCLPDGTCTDTVPPRCASAGGLSRGTGTDCATTECIQACCLGNGTCSDRSVSACQADGGEPLGLGTTCASANTTCRGACCSPIGCFDDLNREECESGGSTYLGNDTSCAAATTTCPTGACCDEGICLDKESFGFRLNQHGCDQRGGGYLGDGTTCATANTTCRGACCTTVGCVDDSTDNECGGQPEGRFVGNDTTCAGQSVCPIGACCFGGSCSDAVFFNGFPTQLSRPGCESGGGTYLGDGTTCATANTTRRGACCTGIGCVDDSSPCDCGGQLDGTYLGHGTTCAGQSVCPIGACCLGGSCSDAVFFNGFPTQLSRPGCESGGGTYLGDGTTCTSTSCTEACCFGTSCEELLPGACTTQGGDPQGFGSDCGFIPSLSPCSVIAP